RLTVDTGAGSNPAATGYAPAPAATSSAAPVTAAAQPAPVTTTPVSTPVSAPPVTMPVQATPVTTPVQTTPATAPVQAPAANTPVQTATMDTGSSNTATTAATPASKLTGLAAMKEAMAAKQQSTTQVQSIPLTMGAIHVYWDEFIDLYRQANKMTVVSNLQLAQLKLLGVTEVGIVSRNIVQFRFMEEEKLVIADFLKKKFNNPTIVLTLQLDESQQTQDIGPAPLSSREQFQQMSEKYPMVKELKDRLNMELDF
ncbi:MAG TPA: DNA polymerase III subunit gamma/tau, partial [Chitinophaga sp.]